MQRAGSIDIAVGDDECGPGERFDGQQCEGRSGGGELGVGGGRKQTGIVEAVERLAVESGDADAELGVAERGVGEDGLDAVGERAGDGYGARSGMRRVVGRSLRIQCQGANQ